MTIYHNITDLVGHTPVVELAKFASEQGVNARIFAKLEAYNPTGSMKDRVALAMIRQAEADGKLAPGGTIIEPTSGNTGIGLAAIGAYLGYRVIIVMPDSMTVERRKLMQIYGAELVLTPGAQGMSGAIAKADALVQEIPGAIVAGQFENPANPQAHIDTTGPELWQQMEGQIDILVAGVGTGGSISGTGRYLKDQNPAIKVVASQLCRAQWWSGWSTRHPGHWRRVRAKSPRYHDLRPDHSCEQRRRPRHCRHPRAQRRALHGHLLSSRSHRRHRSSKTA